MKNLLSLIIVACIFASCSNNNSGNMSNDMAAKNEAQVKEFYEKVLNGHNADIMDQYCTTDFTDHSPAPGHSGKGIDAVKADFKEWFAMMPDVNSKIESISSNGDNVMVRFSMTGTNTGAMGPDMPATGKSVNIEGMEMIAFNKEGKATDRWGYFEEMKWMQQLGMMPSYEEMMKQKQMAEGNMEKAGKMTDQKMKEMQKEGKNMEQMMDQKKK